MNPLALPWGKLLGSRWLHYGVMALACALLLWRGNHYRDSRDEWQAAFAAQKQATIAVEAASKAKAIAAKLDAENHYRQIAERNDDDLASMRAAVRAASARYAGAHRLRPEAAGNAPGGPAAPAEGGDPEGPVGPGAGAELVAIERRDFDTLVDNTVRLLVAREWAKTLNEGALPEPAFGADQGQRSRP